MAESSNTIDWTKKLADLVAEFEAGPQAKHEDSGDINRVDDWRPEAPERVSVVKSQSGQTLVRNDKKPASKSFSCPYVKERLKLDLATAELKKDFKTKTELDKEKEQMRQKAKVQRDTVGLTNKQLIERNDALRAENEALKRAVEEAQNEGIWNFDYYVSPTADLTMFDDLMKSLEKRTKVRHAFAQVEERSITFVQHIQVLENESLAFLDRIMKLREQHEEQLGSLPVFESMDENDEINLDEFQIFYHNQLKTLTDIVGVIKEHGLLGVDSLAPLELNMQDFVDFGTTLNTMTSKTSTTKELLESFREKLELYEEKILRINDQLYDIEKRLPVAEFDDSDEELDNTVTEENFSSTKIVNIQSIEALAEKLRMYKQFMFSLRLKLDDVKEALMPRQTSTKDLSNVSVTDSVSVHPNLCSKCHKYEADSEFTTRELMAALDLVEFGDTLKDTERLVKEINISEN